MSERNPQVDAYIENAKRWQEELKTLRTILLDTPLTEAFKWRIPCYTFQNSNLVNFTALKDSCTLSFFKGALLKDPKGILEKPGNHSQSFRVIRFTSVQEILKVEPFIKEYIHEAIEAEKAGLKIEIDKSRELEPPEELLATFKESPDLKEAFHALTPGRQRGYVLFFSSAKQSKTRQTRIEKYRQQILDGKGINDCTCGLSKKMPACDGSHKALLK
ncbi:Bacteriocin-protection, YdeI/OmpD-Associated family protein [Planctomycetales bacterium 10988]|nr:Bacteriocin-protection, YdeI/OmpD-Associated family protein [Planctomycetales bacterium 10988]